VLRVTCPFLGSVSNLQRRGSRQRLPDASQVVAAELSASACFVGAFIGVCLRFECRFSCAVVMHCDSVSSLPFGGVGPSGTGAYHGAHDSHRSKFLRHDILSWADCLFQARHHLICSATGAA
jgi:hypothetical protein